MADPAVTVAPLTSIRPQRQNANRHTPRGGAALETSVQQDGWIGAITVAADGETFDGSQRVETGAAAGFAEAIVVESDGTRPIIVKRTDIPTAADPRAVRLGLAANRVAELNLAWDTDVLAQLAADTPDVLTGLWREDELADLLAEPDWGAALDALPTGDKAPFQQMTFTVTDEQAEAITAALTAAKQAGPFVDTGNANSNGNALARICEAYRG